MFNQSESYDPEIAYDCQEQIQKFLRAGVSQKETTLILQFFASRTIEVLTSRPITKDIRWI